MEMEKCVNKQKRYDKRKEIRVQAGTEFLDDRYMKVATMSAPHI
jgi:hypothetical protein